jgi:cytochrome bd-type quinol oxidase subunit 1
MTFLAITVELSVFLAVIYGLYLWTNRTVYLQILRFRKRIFAVGFALGVVAGAVITFELGLNWGPTPPDPSLPRSSTWRSSPGSSSRWAIFL